MHSTDLNLLEALDALLEEGSASAAATRLSVTSSAMSRTLGRIRKQTGDPILVRAGRRRVPTPRALAIRARVRAVVEESRSHRARRRSEPLSAAILVARGDVISLVSRHFAIAMRDVLDVRCVLSPVVLGPSRDPTRMAPETRWRPVHTWLRDRLQQIATSIRAEQRARR